MNSVFATHTGGRRSGRKVIVESLGLPVPKTSRKSVTILKNSGFSMDFIRAVIDMANMRKKDLKSPLEIYRMVFSDDNFGKIIGASFYPKDFVEGSINPTRGELLSRPRWEDRNIFKAKKMLN